MVRVPTKTHTSYLQFQTAHYSFQMNITKKEDTLIRYHFIVGNSNKPCLEGNITLPNPTAANDRFSAIEPEAFLDKIDALEECALEDITSEYMAKHSFGKEMLDAIVFFLNSQFPQIKTVKLSDKSYIPCNRVTEDTLDLLTYSIALYKKTWYEDRIDAYMVPAERYTQYHKEIEDYASKEYKNSIPFELFLHKYVRKPYANDMLNDNFESYNHMYETSETFPEFFQKLSRTIPRNEKCKFFKGWLEQFIYSKIKLWDRMWHFDLYPKITVIQQKNMKPIRNTTRRQ